MSAVAGNPGGPEAFTHTHRARAPKQLAIVVIGLLLMAGLLVVFQAVWWLVALLALVAVPAVIDILRDRRATLRVDDTHLTWESGRRNGEVPLERIAKVKLRTTFDLSQRAQVLLKDGQKTRLPMECLPPGRVLDAAFEARGVPTERGLF